MTGAFNYNTATQQPLEFASRSSSFQAIPNGQYMITGNNVAVTLPPTPPNNTQVVVVNGTASITGCSIVRNSTAYTIMGTAQDMTIDTTYFSVTLVYNSSTKDWLLV